MVPPAPPGLGSRACSPAVALFDLDLAQQLRVARWAKWLLGLGVGWLTFTWVAVSHDLVFALAVCRRDVCEQPWRGMAY